MEELCFLARGRLSVYLKTASRPVTSESRSSPFWDPLIATPPFCSIGTLCRCVTTADMWSQSHMYSVNYTTAEDPDAILQHCGQDDAGDRDHSCLK
jgi:hypothetical protein